MGSIFSERKLLLWALVGAAVLALWIGVIALLGSDEPADEAAGAGQSPSGTTEPTAAQEDAAAEAQPPPLRVHYDGVDLRDHRRLVTESENVFTATVAEHVSSRPLKSSDPDDPGRPQLQFRVAVEAVLKSGGEEPVETGSRVTVDQIGAFEAGTAEPVPLVAQHEQGTLTDQPLTDGGRYLFCTVYDPERQFHVVYAQPTCGVPLDRGDDESSRAVVELYRRAVEDPAPDGGSPEGSPETEDAES